MESIFCGCLVGENRGGKIGRAWVFSLWAYQNVLLKSRRKLERKPGSVFWTKLPIPTFRFFELFWLLLCFFFFFFLGVFFYVIIPFLFPSALIISLVFFFSFLLFSFLLFLFFLFSRVSGFLFLRKKFWVLELIFILFLLNEVPSIHNFLLKIMCYFLFYSLIYRDMMVNLYKLYFVFSFFFYFSSKWKSFPSHFSHPSN